MSRYNAWGPTWTAILCIAALVIAAMQARACSTCWPQKGHWDPLRGTLCYGEQGGGDERRN